MFYIEHEGKEIPLIESKIYARCVRCGKKILINFPEERTEYGYTIDSTNIYCPRCMHKELYRLSPDN